MPPKEYITAFPNSMKTDYRPPFFSEVVPTPLADIRMLRIGTDRFAVVPAAVAFFTPGPGHADDKAFILGAFIRFGNFLPIGQFNLGYDQK